MGWPKATLLRGAESALAAELRGLNTSHTTPLTGEYPKWHAWTVLHNPDGTRSIAVVIVVRSPGQGYSTKIVHESEFPSLTDCPLAVLRCADTPTHPAARTWRAHVETTHAARSAGLPRFVR